MSNKIKALGEHVILKTFAKSAGTETKTEFGIVLPTRTEGEIPRLCEVHSIGSMVPEGFIEVGDKTPTPLGNMANVVHPEVANGNKEAKDIDEKFVTVHYRNISCVYK